MRSLAVISALLASLCTALPQQLPLSPQQVSRWNWTSLPSEDETGNLVFSSLAGLLQHWPNTYWRNGHTTILGYLTPGTLLYHGTAITDHDGPPTTPEWAAFDVEHAVPFGHRLLTFSVGPEPLKIMYYDGSSAANMPSGTIDTQELSLHSKVVEGHWDVPHEFVRIKELCRQAEAWGVKGFVRMELDFEIMVCDFTDGLNLVSQMDVMPYNTTRVDSSGTRDVWNKSSSAPPPPIPGIPSWPNPPEGWRGSTRPLRSILNEIFEAGAWHDSVRLPGVVLDYSTFLSFFDPKYTSLVAVRRGMSRHHYRAGNISEEDAQIFQRGDFLDAITKPPWSGSGIHWGDVSATVVNRYAGRLEFLQAFLNPDGARYPKISTGKRMFIARNSVLTLLTPFLLNTSLPTNSSEDWLGSSIERCSTVFTSEIDESTLVSNERLLRDAVLTVSREICRTMGVIWLEAFGAEELPEVTQTTLMAKWAKEVNRLMEWLGWALWTKCTPACELWEVCSLPEWPINWKGNEENYKPACLSGLELIENIHWN